MVIDHNATDLGTGRVVQGLAVLPKTTAHLNDWRFDGACADADPDDFYVERPRPFPTDPANDNRGAWRRLRPVAATTRENDVRYWKSKMMCERCPVLAQCRDYVDELETGTGPPFWFGIWAGEDVKERRRRRAAVLRHDGNPELHAAWWENHHITTPDQVVDRYTDTLEGHRVQRRAIADIIHTAYQRVAEAHRLTTEEPTA